MERFRSGEALVEHTAEREEVRPAVDLQAPGLLGRHVVRGAHDEPGGREVGRRLQLGDAEVHHLHAARGVDHDVRGLHVPMDHLVRVRVVEGGGDLPQQADRLREIETAPGPEPRLERLALDQLHDDETGGPGRDDVVDGDDVRVAQPRRHLRLAHEALLDLLELGRLGKGVQTDALDGHVAAEEGVAGAEDLAERAGAEACHRPVAVPGEAAEGHGPRRVRDGQLRQVLALRGHLGIVRRARRRRQRRRGCGSMDECADPILAIAILLLAFAATACRQAEQELARGPAGKDGPRALVEALADRFGPIEREPAFDALRPRLARAVLVPSRVFDDATAWTDRGDTWRAVEFAGFAAGGTYHMGVRAHAPPPAAPSAYRGRVRLERLSGGRFEWSVDEELAVGRVRPSDLAAALEALFRGAEASSEATARAAVAAGPPAGLEPSRAPPPRRDAGVAAGRSGRDRGAPRGAPDAGRDPRRRPSLRGLPPDLRHAHPDAAPGRGSGRGRVVEPRGVGQPLDAAPAPAGREPRAPRGTGRPPRPPAPARHDRLLDADGAVHRGRVATGGGGGAHLDGDREGLLGALPPGARLAAAVPRGVAPGRAALTSRSRGRARRRAGRPGRRRRAPLASSAATGPGCARPGSCAGSAE